MPLLITALQLIFVAKRISRALNQYSVTIIHNYPNFTIILFSFCELARKTRNFKAWNNKVMEYWQNTLYSCQLHF
jgi:hypothetical protein